ncbi:MAG: TlpA family protein disulfide reductase, partial [Chitinophagaceae bacterium]
ALVEKRYENMKEMLPGAPAPVAKLVNADGKEFSFADFKGKYIYIDFWATWCGPCIKEIPSLIELEKEYHGKDITFVSISFDKDADLQKWKNFISKRTMGEIQFRADAKSNERISKSWNIVTIPRFAILDREGKVVDANAPFPSSKEIRGVLNKLL